MAASLLVNRSASACVSVSMRKSVGVFSYRRACTHTRSHILVPECELSINAPPITASAVCEVEFLASTFAPAFRRAWTVSRTVSRLKDALAMERGVQGLVFGVDRSPP